VEPGKRPRITLTPTLVLKDGKPVIVISVAGGDLQDQTTLNLLLNHIDFGMLTSWQIESLKLVRKRVLECDPKEPTKKQTAQHGNPAGK